MRQDGALAFAALVPVVATLELVSAWLAYHTIGEVASGMLFLAVGLNVVPAILYAHRKRGTATLLVLALFVAIVPYQAVLGERLLSLQTEASNLVAYLYEARFRTGEYPSDLSGYVFGEPSLRPYFQEYRLDKDSGGFVLAWYVGTPSTSHTYSQRNGWGYFPD